MTQTQAYNAVKALLPKIPKTTCGRSAYGQILYRSIDFVLVRRRKYRGKERCIVGYSWTRPYSNSMSGMTYEAVMGYGDTWEEAIEMMKRKIGEPC